MNTLCMGLPFGVSLDLLDRYSSRHGHEVRTLAIEGPADYRFAADETATEVIDRIRLEWPVDTLFCWVPELYPPPRDLESCPARTIAAISDWNLYFPQLEYNLARFDLVLSDKLGVQSLRLPHTTPVYVGPLYSHHPAHHFRDVPDATVDVLFAGNLSPAAHVQRGRVLERVAARSERWRVMFTSGLGAADYRRALSSAKIVVNYALRHEMNLRCFETLACGSLLFVETDNMEIRDLLDENVHFVAYDDTTIGERLEFYLEHDDERARIAQQGHERIRDLAGGLRMDAILDSIHTLGAGVRPFPYLSDAHKRLAECMMYASSQVASQRQLARKLAADAVSNFPGDMPMSMAKALLDLEHVSSLSRDERRSLLHGVLQHLLHVTTAMPECIVPWLNLAFVCRRSNVPENEARFLELALEVTSADLGGLLMGSMDDPYYVAWRRALATDEAEAGLLHARAHARLADILLSQGNHRDALHHADAARGLAPEIAPAFRAAGRASLDLGMPEHAVEILRDGLAVTAFDPEMRLALVHALHDAGDRPALRTLAEESARIFEVSPKTAHLARMFLEYCTGS